MTYGWAILIIVIVAVILYSMGIFNPSSSVTFTSSGFSPFTVSSSLCNNLGYKIAVLAGPIPNNANSITINKVFLTSATGANTTTASYTLTNPVTLKSGQSTTIIIPNVACTAAKVHYSLSAKIQYSYTAGTLGLQYVNTSGTIAGTSISGKPSALTTYEPITITNSQSSATPNPFQQMVNFTSSDNGWTSISTGNFGQNVEFFYYNGTIIPSWLESYTDSNAIWWLKIAAIPAGSSETVYVGFAPTTTNLFNTVNDGEAPQLSSTYAEYDDGANVFNYYENFAGTSFPSNFTSYVGDATLTVDNGLHIQVANNGCSSTWAGVIYNNPINAADSIVEAYSSGTTAPGPTDVGIYTANSDTAGGYAGVADTWGWGWGTISGGYGNIGNPFDISSGNGVASIYWIRNGDEGIGWNYNFVSSTNTNEGWSSSLYASIQDGQCSPGANMEYYWFRVRSYPPNGVMPSVTFSSVA